MTSMRWKQWGTVVAVVVVLMACNGRESVTGGYGSGVVTGKVTMAAGLSSDSPAGVRLSVAGTGISMMLTADGTFALSGVPDKAELRFTREDGINTSVMVAANGAPVSIQLTPNGGKPGRVRAVNPIQPPYSEFEGIIKTPGATQLVITDSHGKDVTILLTDSTVIRHGDTTIAAGDLKAGDRVHVKANFKDNTYTATLVLVQNTGSDDTSGGGDDQGNGGTTMTANGTVKEVASDHLVVTSTPKGDVTVQVDSSTIIRKQGDVITLADIHAGDEVNTMGTRVDDHTEKARQIEVRGNSGHH